MAPFFFFDFTFDQSTPPAQMQISQPERKERSTKTDNLCPYRIPTIDEIVKDIESASYRTDKQKFVSDLFECGAIAVSNMVDLSQRKMREERYLQIIRNYKLPERSMLVKIFAKIYALLASVVYDNGKFNDNLGELFMRCNLGNKNTGAILYPLPHLGIHGPRDAGRISHQRKSRKRRHPYHFRSLLRRGGAVC